MAGKRTNVEQMTGPATNGFTKAYGTAHDSEDDVSNYGDGDSDHDHEDDHVDEDDDHDHDHDDHDDHDDVGDDGVDDDHDHEEEETVWVFLVPRVSQKTVLGSRVNIGPH